MSSLIAELARLGPEADKATLDEIIARREEAIPYLVRVATDEEYWEFEPGKDYSIWASICAIHLLSVIGGKEAEEAVGEAIRKYYDDTGDWLTEDMPSVLAALGPNSFGMIARMVSDHDLDVWVRNGASRALLMMAGKHPEVRERALALLRDVIASEKDIEAITWLLDVLIQFKEEKILPFVKSLFDRKMVDTSDLAYSEVLDVYAGKYDHGHEIKDPMDIFSNEKGNFYRETNCTIDEQIRRNRREELYDDYVDASSAPADDHDSYGAAGPMKPVKVGRNDPCPCGSGKKYKKCCLPLDRKQGLDESGESGFRISRLSITRHMEHLYRHPDRLEEISRIGGFAAKGFKDAHDRRWTLGRISRMGTQEIIEKLRSFNIKFDRDQFERQAQNYRSAERLADDHYSTQKHTASGLDEDFIWLAIIELWKRMMPERYNVEMIDDHMQEGYEAIEEKRYMEGIEKWAKAWQMIKSIVPRRIKSVEEVDAYIPGLTQSVFNWCQDFEMELGNAAIDDGSFHAKRKAYCSDFLQTYPESDQLIIVNMSRALAESHAALGEMETADKIFQKLTERFPDDPWAYIGWGDMYADFREFPANYEKAEEIYRKALARCRSERDVIIERLNGLKDMKRNRIRP